MIDPADGTKRVWMVWAHWCPYCQEELPSLAAAYEDLAITFPGIDIATVTSSIDPSRGNPLESYLEQQQFPFPVIVDVDLSLAGQMGVGAYPFWVITDGDGTVLFRSAGLLEHTQLVSLMTSLSEYEA
jgi:thiol-disulfide isomerase/thioredoxin